jgi:O-antigen ligase
MNLKAAEKVIFFLTLLFIPTQLGLHFWPQFSYIFSLKIDYLSPTFYFWDLLVLFLILIWALRKPKINKLAFNIFFVFMLTQMFSLFSNFSFGVGLVRLEQYLIAGLFGLYLSSKQFAKITKPLFLGLAISIIFECLLAIGQIITSSTLGFWILGERSFNIATPAIAKFDYEGRQFLRPYATFPHPNVLGGFLAIILPIIILTKQKSYQLLFWIALGLSTITNFLTVSRVAILTGLAEGFFLLRSKWLYLFIGIIVLLSPILFVRYSSLINFDNLSFDRREDQLQLAISIFEKSPLIGIGINNFIPYASSDLAVGPNRFLQPIHNIYLLELTETGIIGFLGLVLLFFYPINQLIKNNSKETNLLLMSWIVILFLGVFDHYLLTLPQGYRVLFLVWGITLSSSPKI